MLNIEYIVSYCKGLGNKLEGFFIVGEFVKFKKGMIFDVLEIDKF